ncbi:MAG: hypothetical protein JW913_03745 [Chitinispirillaceae bacterium]|nr:hypothetical protein [Chitinispirillaceae bacterium]
MTYTALLSVIVVASTASAFRDSASTVTVVDMDPEAALTEICPLPPCG